jgi:hypothetical protein
MKLDNTDARYHFRMALHRLGHGAEMMFPGREQCMRNEVQNGSIIDEKMGDQFYLGNRLTGEDYLAGSRYMDARLSWAGQGFIDSSRDRVKLYEMWFKQPIREQTIRAKQLPQFHGLAYDNNNGDMRHAILSGDATLVDRVNMRCFYMLFTESGVLAAGRSPYRHNEFPFTPITCYRRGRDNAPYGIIRGIRDPQDGFNRRMAKSIFAYTAYRVIADADAIDEKKAGGWEEVRKEAGRPDALLVKKRGTELKVERDHEMGDAQFKVAQAEGSLILDASGVTGDNLGLETNAQSGKAIIAKQSEGSLVTAEPFDNLRLGAQISGEKKLSNIEQFWTEEKVLRITDVKGRPSYSTVNKIEKQPDGSARVLNDVTATKADFVIDQQDYHATLRQAATQTFMEVVLPKVQGLDPKLFLRLFRMGVDSSDWPNKEEIVKELDAITGYKDPSGALTPEEKEEQRQAEEQQAQAQQLQQQQQDAAFKAELEEKTATAKRLLADAERLVATAEKTRAETMHLESGKAFEAQQQMADAQAQAQQQVDALHQTIADLQAQARDTAAQHETERYKADREHEAAVKVAEIQYPQQPPTETEVQEAVADLQQDVQALVKLVTEIAKKAQAGESSIGGSGVKLDIGELASKGMGDAMGKIGKVVEGLNGAGGEVAKTTAKAAATLEAAAKSLTQATSALAQATAKANEPKPEPAKAAESEPDVHEYTIDRKDGTPPITVTKRKKKPAKQPPPAPKK